MPSQSMPELMAQVDRIERQVAKISAYRELTGSGLQEAKEAVDAL